MTDSRAHDRRDALAPALAELGVVGARLWERGWAECNAGNLSVSHPPLDPALSAADPDDGKLSLSPAVPELAATVLLVTATGSRLREVLARPERTVAVLAISEDGRHAAPLRLSDDPPPPPTSELVSHLAVLAAARRSGRSEQRAIVHTHPDELIVLTHDPSLETEKELTRRLWSMIPEARLLLAEGVGLVHYRPPGSEAQAAATAAALSERPVVLWDRHGAIATGEDLEQAFDRIDAANKAASLYLQARRAGFEPKGLDSREIEELARIFFG